MAISVSTRLSHQPYHHFRTLKEGLYLALFTRTLIKNIENQIQSSMVRLIKISQLYPRLVTVVRGGVCAGQYLCSVEKSPTLSSSKSVKRYKQFVLLWKHAGGGMGVMEEAVEEAEVLRSLAEGGECVSLSTVVLCSAVFMACILV